MLVVGYELTSLRAHMMDMQQTVRFHLVWQDGTSTLVDEPAPAIGANLERWALKAADACIQKREDAIASTLSSRKETT